MAISNLTIPYPDFKYNDTINPDEFDSNFDAIKTKVNELVSNINSPSLRNFSDTGGDGKYLAIGENSTNNKFSFYSKYVSDNSNYRTVASVTPDGIWTQTYQPFVEINRSSAFSIPSAVSTKITGFAMVTDRQGEYASDQIVVKETGVYAIYMYTPWASFTANRLNNYVYVNGSALMVSENNTGGVAQTSTNQGTVLKDLTAGDVLTFYAYQNSGSAQNISSTRVRVIKLF
jgi:hypothetical protein